MPGDLGFQELGVIGKRILSEVHDERKSFGYQTGLVSIVVGRKILLGQEGLM